MGELIIAKHRNGALDNVKLRFIGRLAKFTNPDGDQFGEFNKVMLGCQLNHRFIR